MTATQIKLALVLLGLALFGYGCFTVGQKLERLTWTERESKINAEAAEAIRIAADDARKTEREQAEQQLAVMTDYYEGLEADRDAKDDFVAGVVSGRIRLSIPTKHQACGHAQGEGAAGAGGTEGAPRAELSDEAGKFLIGEALRADAHTRQLNAVIGLLEACEKVAGVTPSPPAMDSR